MSSIPPDWKPLPPMAGKRFSSQQLFLASGMNPNNYIKEVLYHGTRGVGKTEALLMTYAMHVFKGYSQWRGVIFRKEYKALEDVIKKSKKLFYKIFGDRCFFKESKADYKWVFYDENGVENGEELLFRAIDSVADYDDKFHGQEFQFIGWEELCSWKDLSIYFTMMSCLRCSTDDPDNAVLPPLIVRSTTNPYGAGRSVVKRYFIDVSKPGELYEKIETHDEEEYVSKRMHIFGSWRENIYLNKDYPLSFSGIKESDPNKYRSWLYGDWEAVSGGMFGDLWNYDDHVINPCILDNCYVDRSFDYGTASPFSTLWFAELNGETKIKMQDGTMRQPPKGSLIVINEYYGSKSLTDTNTGLNLHASKIAENIKQMESSKIKGKKISLFTKINDGVADNSIWNDSKVRGLKTVADLMEEKGIKWKRSDKAKGSRVAGIVYFKEMLIATKNNDNTMPHIYVFSDCKFFINNIPALQVDESNPDDIDSSQPDHDWDALRYRILTKKKNFKIFNSY